MNQFQSQFESGETYVLAVSGGVDSVVMLDMMSQIEGLKLVIAHFDHQIRGWESARDADFVRQLAQAYRVSYYLGFGGLGRMASEEVAREARYQFLRSIAKQVRGQLCVAHHRDDLIETIAVNVIRGTGWRGLAVFGASDVLRPMLSFTKQQLIDYARNRGLNWCEDSTNLSSDYLRNRLRNKLKLIKPQSAELLVELYDRQQAVKVAIEAECHQLSLHNDLKARYFWTMIDISSATELLSFVIKRQFKISLTRPQLERAVLAIKLAKAGDKAQIGEKLEFRFSKLEFIINQIKN